MNTLQFLGIEDGLEVTWYNGNMSKKYMQDTENEDNMLEAEVILMDGLDSEDETPLPVVAKDNTLQEWIEAVLDSTLSGRRKGIKVILKHEDVLKPTLKMFASMKDRMNIPVWIHADILSGQGTNENIIDPQKFFLQVDQTFPSAVLSVGWISNCSKCPHTRDMVVNMYNLIKTVKQPVSIAVRVDLVKEAWPHFKWLLNQNPLYTLTIFTPHQTDDQDKINIYDLLYIRNDWYLERVFYNIPRTKMREFQELSITAGSPLNFFDTKDRDGLSVTWAHAANSIEDMETALRSDVMMLEADILLRGQDTVNQTDIPIMAHPPDIDSDNTFQNWFTNAVQTKKGLKLDFKSIGAVKPCLQILNSSSDSLQQPVWLNADILVGPNAFGAQPVDAVEFICTIQQYFPQATLSIGWKTAWNNSGTNEGYTQAMVEEMAFICRDLTQPITFPVRAIAVRPSWPQLKWLLDQSFSYSLTIWTAKADDLQQKDMQWVRDQGYDKDRIYYDLPDNLMPRK